MNCCGFVNTPGKVWTSEQVIEIIPQDNAIGFYRIQILDINDNILGETLSNGDNTPQYFLVIPGIQGKIKVIIDDREIAYPGVDGTVEVRITNPLTFLFSVMAVAPDNSEEGNSGVITFVNSYTITTVGGS